MYLIVVQKTLYPGTDRKLVPQWFHVRFEENVVGVVVPEVECCGAWIPGSAFQHE